MLRNDGTGSFAFDVSAFPIDQGLRKTVNGDLRAADIDADGDLDVLGTGFNAGMTYFTTTAPVTSRTWP